MEICPTFMKIFATALIIILLTHLTFGKTHFQRKIFDMGHGIKLSIEYFHNFS